MSWGELSCKYIYEENKQCEPTIDTCNKTCQHYADKTKQENIMESEECRLGRIAYEAYCETTGWKSAVTGAGLPKFYSTPEAVRVGWIAAAKAVKEVI